MSDASIPDRGNLIIVSFDPQAGHEQAGRRPALVLSRRAYARSTKIIVCCPITNTRRRTHLHVPLPPQAGLAEFVMCEQLRSLDYRARRATKVGDAPRDLLDEVLAVIEPIPF